MKTAYSRRDRWAIPMSFDCIVVGGGFYGCMLALYLNRLGSSVSLIEREGALLRRASFRNQARIHNGYHYPRSFLTALRSRVNYPRFLNEFSDCIDNSHEMIYAIARNQSKVTAHQFQTFCQRIGAPIQPAPKRLSRLFDSERIEAIFAVQEAVFDAEKLRKRMSEQISATRINLQLSAEARKVQRAADGRIELVYSLGEQEKIVRVRQVFNCTYSRMNMLLTNSGLLPIPLKHELTEIALVQPPEELSSVGVTVMCGPFFSLMPFPARQLHSLSHVRYTPHVHWHDGVEELNIDPYRQLAFAKLQSRYQHMIKDAVRFLPSMNDCRYQQSLWEIKTVLPRSEVDDGRPILMQETSEFPGLINTMGSKIDNVHDMIASLSWPGVDRKRETSEVS